MKRNIDDKTKKEGGAENSVWVLQDSYLGGHTGAILSVAAKGEIIASASSDNTVRVWDKNSLKEIATLYGHNGEVFSVAIIDENRVVSGSWDKTIKIWDIKSKECLRTLKGHSSMVTSIAILDENRALSGSYDNTIKIWDIKSGECLRTLGRYNNMITSIAILDENRALSGSADNTIKIWDIKSGECLRTLEGHNSWVYSIAILDENRVVSGSADKTIKIWDIKSGECLRTLEGHNSTVTSIAILDENRVVSGSYDETIKIWDIKSEECIRTLEGHNSTVTSIAILDENMVVSSPDDETIKIWDIKSEECIRTLEGHSSQITSIAILDENRVVNGSHDKTIKIWDIKSGECIRTLEGYSYMVYSVAVLDENMVISGSDDGTIKICDIKSGECLQTLKGHSNRVTSIAILDENRVVSGSADQTIKIWDIGDLKNPKILYDIPRKNRGLAVDGDTLFVIEESGEISAFDVSELPDMKKVNFEPILSPKRPIGSISAKDGLIAMGSVSGDLIVQKIEIDKSSVSVGKYIEQRFYIKTLLLGDSGVGKTTLGYFLEHQTHNQNIASTHGMRFFEFGVNEKIAYDNESKNGNFVFTVWDFGGQPEYQVAHKQNFDGARVILLVVDLERKGDEDNSVGFWINTIKQHLSKTKKEQLGVFVVGTKSGECTALDSIKARIESEISELKDKVYSTPCNTKSDKETNPADKLKGSIKEHIKNHFAISNEKLLFSDSLLALEHVKERQKEIFWTLTERLKLDEYNDGALNAALDFLGEMGSIERLDRYLILKPYWKNILATSILRKAQNNEQVVGAIAKRDLYRYDFDATFDKLLDDDSAAKSDETLYKEFLENKEQKLKNLYIGEIVSNFLTDKICYVKNGMFVFPSRFRNKHKEYEMDGYHRVEGINLVSKRNVEVTIATVVCSIFYSGKYDVLKHLESGVKIRDKKGNEFFVEFGREDIFVHTKNQDSASIIIHSKTTNEKSDEKAEKQLVKFVTAVLNSCLEPLYSVKSYKIKNGDDFVGEATFVVKNSAFVDESKNKYGDFLMEKIDDTSLMIDGRDIVDIEERIKKEQERVKNEIENVGDGAANESKDSFVILHLSDLHFTKETKIDNEILLLNHDAANIECYNKGGLKAVDYIVLSGDLSASGGADEFETVAGFIEKLIEACDIDAQKIIIAPGNHDYSRDATHSAYKVQKFEAAKFKENVDYKINDDIYLQRQSEKWKKKFKNFSNKLYEAVYNKAFPSDTSKQIFVMGDKNISFVILNTSTQIDHFYPRKVGFDAEGLIEAQSKMSKESVKIAVGHHPINLEEHYDFVNNLQSFKFTAYMHGHVHRNNMVSFNEYAFNNNKTVNIGSGLFWSKEPKKSMVPGVPYRYNVVKIDKEKSITIETREREKTSMHWRGSSLYLDESNRPSSIKKILHSSPGGKNIDAF